MSDNCVASSICATVTIMKTRRLLLAILLATGGLLFSVLGLSQIVNAQQLVSWNNPGWGSSTDVIHSTVKSPAMGNIDVGYTIYLPPGYNSSQNRYPTVYFLHGIQGHEWNYHNSLGSNPNGIVQLVKSGAVEPMILVFPNGGSGLNYIDAPGNCADTKACPESMLINELLPHIDQTYRTIPEKEFRAIQGFSMGGMGATYLGTKYPELFSSIATQSSACQLLANCESVKNHIQSNISSNASYLRDTVAFRVSYGSQEGSPSGSGIAGWQSSLHTTLNGYGIQTELLSLLGTGHNMSAQHSVVNPSTSRTFGLDTLMFHSDNFGNGSTPPGPSVQPSASPTTIASPVSSPVASPIASPVSSPNPTDEPSPSPSTEEPLFPDYNRDGLITYSDFEMLLPALFGSNCAINLLGSCEIDLFDYNAFMTAYESENL